MIRKVTTADIPAITAIYNHYITDTTVTFEVDTLSERQMADRIRDISSRYPYYVCEVDGCVAGYSYAHLWRERAAYRHTLEVTVYLAPAYFRRGIGSRLMRRLIDDCKAAGYKVLIACITDGNVPSVAMHHALCFRKLSHFK